ncbi:MAG: hypothetical protein H0X37_25530, partial [Herpetosiphonaceae bacterium]|nr:hypothetical protein [Herpetosiphonaceae bacterium]
AGDQLDVLGHDQGWLHIHHNAQDGWVACNSTTSLAAPVPAVQPGQLSPLLQKAKLSTAEINQARQLIHALGNVNERGDKFEALQSKTVYRNQRDNRAIDANGNLVETRSGQMCNLTSLAMCLDYLGIPNPHPAMQYEDALEKVRVDNQLPARTESNGWGGVAVKLGAKVNFLGAGASHDHQWYTNNVLPALRAGHAMMMSICGHIVRVQDVTNEGLIIDDPYGKGRLLPNPGCQDLKWHYASFNEYQTPNQAVGEDNIWAWGDVSTHCMRWIAELSRPLGLPVGPQPVPAVNFSDDGIVVPGQTD